MKLLFVSAAGLIVLAGQGLRAQAPATPPAKPQAKPPVGVPVEYTAAQSAQGKIAYDQNCGSCHGRTLDNGEFGPGLRGSTFNMNWAGGTVGDLVQYMSMKMPPAAPGSLNAAAYAQIATYILQQNGIAPGAREMPTAPASLASLRIPGAAERRGAPGGGLTPGVALPNAPPRSTLLDRMTPVTEAMLANPSSGDWLTWRRSLESQGYSPLKQIDRGNVKNLRVAWSWSLPPGPNTAPPLVHDGVMFVQGYTDQVEALDASTGDLLWHWQRALPEGVRPAVKKSIAILGNTIFAATSDVHMVALDAHTGLQKWDTEIGPQTWQLTGGPLIAKGKVIIGTGGQQPGGNFIVALDAATGKEAWRFRTIPLPDAPGGNTWNGLPAEKRTGGSSWVPGSYDPALNLVYFGVAQTYDTGPLRLKSNQSGMTNDALYTDSTIALNPDTGKLVWHYQHVSNDQWDFDWVFERTLLKLPINGAMKTVSMTAGKIAIYDVLEADTGKYAFSFDMGLQNIVTGIDPATGRKTINPALIPGDGEAKLVCPHAGGARSWIPSAYNPETKLLYSPLVESCMDLVPTGPNEKGFLSTGVRVSLRPRLDSDGQYGRIQATNLETRQTVFIKRQRAPETSGILATAGGLIFSGSLDRWFSARNDRTGEELWRIRLNDVPGSAPVTFVAGGKQYIAVTVGNGSAHAATWPGLVPEIQNPPNRGGSVWVFELP